MHSGPQSESFLRWAGSKRKSLPQLGQFWNSEFDRYIEPFAGSASLFFYLRPKRAVLNDLNEDLVSTLTTVRDHPLELYHSLRGRPVTEAYYYKLRALDPECLPPITRAARFIYLNRFCFNGIYRTNRDGRFNVPFSGTKTGKKPTKELLLDCSEALQETVIEAGDFEAILRTHTRAGDFVYMDPPYATASRRIFKEYTAGAFGETDLARLQNLLLDMDQRGVKFVLSYAYCPEALNGFSVWQQRKYFVQRNVAGFAKSRRMAAELLITNIAD